MADISLEKPCQQVREAQGAEDAALCHPRKELNMDRFPVSWCNSGMSLLFPLMVGCYLNLGYSVDAETCPLSWATAEHLLNEGKSPRDTVFTGAAMLGCY